MVIRWLLIGYSLVTCYNQTFPSTSTEQKLNLLKNKGSVFSKTLSEIMTILQLCSGCPFFLMTTVLVLALDSIFKKMQITNLQTLPKKTPPGIIITDYYQKTKIKRKREREREKKNAIIITSIY